MRINFVGHASGNLGLGSTLRQFAKALIASGELVSILDVDAGHGRSGMDLELQGHFVDRLVVDPQTINVWVIGARDIAKTALAVCRDPGVHAGFNVAFVWWELPVVPLAWVQAADAFDAILTGSEFVRGAFGNAVGRVPVLLAHQPLDIPVDIVPDRSRFGIADQLFTVFTGFDALSDSARKNPTAGVLAFRRAFPDRSDVQLVVKMAGSASASGERERTTRAALAELIGEDPRVRIIEQALSYRDLLSLYASCDVVMSLHRSEGLGLVPMEAMRLGRPVVATGWSGNMTYMDHTSAALVRYELVDTDDGAAVYGPSRIGVQARWAEPSVDDAASWLRLFADKPDVRLRYGERARAGSLAYDARARQGRYLAELRCLLEQWTPRATAEFERLAGDIELTLSQRRSRLQAAGQGVLGRAQVIASRAFDRHIGWRLR